MHKSLKGIYWSHYRGPYGLKLRAMSQIAHHLVSYIDNNSNKYPAAWLWKTNQRKKDETSTNDNDYKTVFLWEFKPSLTLNRDVKNIPQ